LNKLKSDIERYFQLAGKKTPHSGFRIFLSCFNARLMPVTFLRVSEFLYWHHLGHLAKIFSMLNVVIFGIEVSPKVEIGGGLFLPHTVGTVIGAERIGENVTIMQGVTLGSKEPDLGFTLSTRPIIGNHVLIGAGAKVIGRVTVGDYAKIGANAVVVHDIPAHAVAVGIPAQVIKNAAAN